MTNEPTNIWRRLPLVDKIRTSDSRRCVVQFIRGQREKNKGDIKCELFPIRSESRTIKEFRKGDVTRSEMIKKLNDKQRFPNLPNLIPPPNVPEHP